MLALRQQQLAFLAQHWRHNELVKLQVCVCVCVCVCLCVSMAQCCFH
jgi:hypothetical protein